MANKKIQKGYNEKGEEVPNPEPIRTTPRMRITPNKLREFQAMLRTASYLAKNEGYETLEESEDFDVGEDMDPSSPWEMAFDPTAGKELTKMEIEFLNQQRRSFTEKFGKAPPWWHKFLRKKQQEAAPEDVKKDSKKPSRGQPREEEEE